MRPVPAQAGIHGTVNPPTNFLCHLYELAPAFDIVKHPSAATHPQSIGVGAAGAASTSANALPQCGRFLLKRDEANEIIEAVRDVVAGWRPAYSHAGVGTRDLAILDTCIAPLR